MKTDITKATAEAAEGTLFLGDDWFDPLEAGVRTRIRGFIEELLEAELGAALGRVRYERPRLGETGVGGGSVAGTGHRHGHRERQLMGTFGAVTVRVPRARLDRSDGKTAEWKNATIPAYQRRTKQADALIAGAYLAGTNTRRVRRALAALFGGAVGKDTVSRVWRKTLLRSFFSIRRDGMSRRSCPVPGNITLVPLPPKSPESRHRVSSRRRRRRPS